MSGGVKINADYTVQSLSTFCTIFLEKGGSLRLCQAIAGHSTIQVTERYAHVSSDYLAQAGAILNR